MRTRPHWWGSCARCCATWLFDPTNRDEAIRIYLAEAPELDAQQVDGIYDQMVRQQMLSRTLRPSLLGTENVLALAHQLGALPEIPPTERWVDLSYLGKVGR